MCWRVDNSGGGPVAGFGNEAGEGRGGGRCRVGVGDGGETMVVSPWPSGTVDALCEGSLGIGEVKADGVVGEVLWADFGGVRQGLDWWKRLKLPTTTMVGVQIFGPITRSFRRPYCGQGVIQCYAGGAYASFSGGDIILKIPLRKLEITCILATCIVSALFRSFEHVVRSGKH